jgi:predicted RNA-binding protein with PUA-like domain
MAFFLAKTDPETYSIEQFSSDRRTVWDGVSNPQAVASIKSMRKGDRVFIYHSGGVSSIVGLARVASTPEPDKNNSRSWVVEMAFVSLVDPPVSLAEIKQTGLFDDWALIRQGRLSTMPAPLEFVEWMRVRYPRLKL